MALEPIEKAALVSARDLPRIVEAAIKAAGTHLEVAGPIVVKWDLIGRVLRDEAQAHVFADTVARNVSAHGIHATPAVLTIDKKVIAGFFERAAVPQLREL